MSTAVGEGFVADLISTSLKPFTTRYPGICFNLSVGSSDQVTHDIITGDAHIGLVYNPRKDKRLRSLKKMRQPLALLTASNSRLAKLAEPLLIESLSNEPCALLKQSFGIGTIELNRCAAPWCIGLFCF